MGSAWTKTKEAYNSEQAQATRASAAGYASAASSAAVDKTKEVYNSEQGQTARAQAAGFASAGTEKAKDAYRSEQGQNVRAQAASGAAAAGAWAFSKAVDGGVLRTEAAQKVTESALNAGVSQATGGKVTSVGSGVTAAVLQKADENRDQTKTPVGKAMQEAAKKQ